MLMGKYTLVSYRPEHNVGDSSSLFIYIIITMGFTSDDSRWTSRLHNLKISFFIYFRSIWNMGRQEHRNEGRHEDCS